MLERWVASDLVALGIHETESTMANVISCIFRRKWNTESGKWNSGSGGRERSSVA